MDIDTDKLSDTGKTCLFLSLPVCAEFARQAGKLPRKGLQARWYANDDHHMTLRFLGDTDNNMVPEIIEALSAIRRAPFTTEIKGMGYFEKAKVLYADVPSYKKPEALVTDITDKLERFGFDFGTRPFTPHVTLARLQSLKGVDNYIRHHGPRLQASCRQDYFSLTRSTRGEVPDKRYLEIHRFPLRP